MAGNIPERDWKIFRRLRELALERFCERVLHEANEVIADDGRSFHERYLAVYRLIGERGETLADVFNDPRRSTALLQLAQMESRELLTPEEIAQFSEETREFLRRIRELG